ncbi:hypothetical protein DPMN_061788 [Dreissena polymorpha]|uniref:G-protein coupled receptors family 2 profile 1 domain-containing protein n=3 Tax=Dreissena polymorpha TaxID=45954 RepID=A0A9D4C824_DREPO|nr:hypothetical protein DPMN_061788 [Dreissena polymorpha]
METCGLLLVLVLCREVFCQSHYCRSKFGVYEVADYNIHACAWCYFFLFPERDYKPNPLTHTLEIQTNGSRVYPDINNKSATGEICATLSSDECDKWRLCCLASRDCCTRQLMSSAVDDNTSCPTTWDGYGCWDAGEPGTTSYISCPNFLQYSVPTRSALKTCNADGKWLTKGPLSLEWTDYTPCLSYEELKVSIYISVGCQIASLLCLLPSVVIFLMYK